MSFDTQKKAAFIQLSNGNRSARSTSTAWGTVLLAEAPVSRGRHQWTFKIDHKERAAGMAIGVATMRFTPATSNIGAGSSSWGFSCSGKKGGGGAAWSSYHHVYSAGDIIGIDLDMDGGKLSFSKNGENLGVAFTNLGQEPVIPGVCFGGKSGSLVTLMSGGAQEGVAFSSSAKSPHITLDVSRKTATNNSRSWGSVVVDVPPVTSGVHRWDFKIASRSSGGGLAVGVVAQSFLPDRQNVGTGAGTWGFSSSGRKGGGGAGWQQYHEVYGTGDVLGVEVNMDVGSLKFYKNHRDLGVAFPTQLRGQQLRPGVCFGGQVGSKIILLGGSSGGRAARAPGGSGGTPTVPAARGGAGAGAGGPMGGNTFNPTRKATGVQVSPDRKSTFCSVAAWGSIMMASAPLTSGVWTYEFRIDKRPASSGVALGVVDATTFNPQRHNVGAGSTSWGYSGSSGKKGGGGAAWSAYGTPFTAGDRVSMEVDADAGTLSFARNSTYLGVAFSGLQGRQLVPAVCFGSCGPGASTARITCVKVTRAAGAVSRVTDGNLVNVFGAKRAGFINVSNNNRTASSSSSNWGSALVEMTPITSGDWQVTFKINSRPTSAGLALGVVDAASFNHLRHNVGAGSTSWGYSGSSGKKGGGGAAWSAYGTPFTSGDTLQMFLRFSVNNGSLSFSRNGRALGEAFGNLGGRALLPAVCFGACTAGASITIVELKRLDVQLVVEQPSAPTLSGTDQNVTVSPNTAEEDQNVTASSNNSEEAYAVSLDLLTSPTTEEELVTSLNELLAYVRTSLDTGRTPLFTKTDVIQIGMSKKKSSPPDVWTRSVAQLYGQLLKLMP